MRSQLTTIEHPLLDARAFLAYFPHPIGEIPSPPWLQALLSRSGMAPFAPDDSVRSAVRDLLRAHGFKPSGRSKPASEYLWNASEAGPLKSINAAVDVCNVVSLHSGIPISVVDLDLAASPLRIDVAPDKMKYVFNTGGQEIDIGNLWCLFDANGPCANAVKDAQRTKTHPGTRATLCILWGPALVADRVENAVHWYRDLLERLGAKTIGIPEEPTDAQEAATFPDSDSTWSEEGFEEENASEGQRLQIAQEFARPAIPWRGVAVFGDLRVTVPYQIDLHSEESVWVDPDVLPREMDTLLTIDGNTLPVHLRLQLGEEPFLRLGRNFVARRAWVSADR